MSSPLLLLLLTLLMISTHALFGKMNIFSNSKPLVPKKSKLSKEFLGIVESSGRGLIDANNKDIIAAIKALPISISADVSGSWELIWTTEKETLFFAKNGLFGKPCKQITQTIDLDSASLNNKILFEGNREFSVDGNISLDDEVTNRINFKFTGALLAINPLRLSLPPFGKGWFENIYVDDDYRVSADIRGDFLISRRVVS